MNDSDEKFLTGQQAAEFLGVKSSTLYAYASRGMIESMPAKTARERQYRLSDLIRLRQSSRGFKSTRGEQDVPTWTGPVIKSSITEITADGHKYRGESAWALALGNTPFEAVAEMLWETGADESAWVDVKPITIPDQAYEAVMPDVDYLDVLKLILVMAEMSDPVARKLLREDRFDTARSLILTMAMAPSFGEGKFAGDASQKAANSNLTFGNSSGTFANSNRQAAAKGAQDFANNNYASSKFPIAHTILNALCDDVSEERAAVINCALVFCADHELNASALAARIAASCDASIYSCLLSALGSFSGSLHGSASRRAEDIVTNSLRFKSARAWLKDYLQEFERIPGFGTDLYQKGDPRAKALIETAQRVARKNEHLDRLVEIVECVREHFEAEPNLDVGLAAISYALNLPPGSGSIIFAVSRTAGWIAHAVEQREYGGVIRPRAKYIGKA